MRLSSIIFLVCLFTLCLPVGLSAQGWDKLNISAGGGFSEPVENAGESLDTGWNIDFRGGYNATHRLALDLDFNYNRWNLNSAALARFGEPGGDVSVWSISFQPMQRLLPRRSPLNAYLTGGFGLYHRNLSLTQPTTVTSLFCDPFFGCFPVTFTADQVVASVNNWKPGFNAGAGVEARLGASRARVFGEARYQRMFTNHGADLTFVPVTFGIRW
ncbi:MAG TPA: outer membrane beta-barrel protein [Candidatus Sulfotelmatobacter sp.]|nr:outer membrane beta-barrel protein [Candidatus Sulfotelmatobacter sp.]